MRTSRTVWLDNPCDTDSGLAWLWVKVRFAAASLRLVPGACFGFSHRNSHSCVLNTHRGIVAFVSRDFVLKKYKVM